MFDAHLSQSKCAHCKGFYHGPDHAVGTNPCCLSGISFDPERDTNPYQKFPSSKQMLVVHATGAILRGGRSLHDPIAKQFPPVQLNQRFKTSPNREEHIPTQNLFDPFHTDLIQPYPKLSLDCNSSLRSRMTKTSTLHPYPKIDEQLPPEERLALRRFMTEKAGHIMDRDAPEPTCGQWWENASTSTSENDEEEDDEEDNDNNNNDNTTNNDNNISSWALRGKKMCKIEPDFINLSPRTRYMGDMHDSGGGIQLSSAHRWLRRSSSMIISQDAGKTGFRSVNALEYALRKYDHALRCKSYAQAAKQWSDEYNELTEHVNWKFYNEHLARRSIDAKRHAKEVGLENALRGGGYDFGTGLNVGERQLINSGFSATSIHDVEWSGDVVKNLDIVESVERPLFGSPKKISIKEENKANSPGSSYSIHNSIHNTIHTSIHNTTKSATPTTLANPTTSINLNHTNSIMTVDPYLQDVGTQRNVVSIARTKYWDVFGMLEKDRNEVKMIVGALYQCYTTTEFLEILEKRPNIISKYLCISHANASNKIIQEEDKLPHIEALGGVQHFKGTDLIIVQKLKKLPNWSLDIFLCLGIVLGIIDIDNPFLLSKNNKEKTKLVAEVQERFFGIPLTSNINKCWKLLDQVRGRNTKEKILQEKIRNKKNEIKIIKKIKKKLNKVLLKTFERSRPRLVLLLLEKHNQTCRGQPSLNRWKMDHYRNPLDRVVEGLCIWLHEISAYYQAALPFWSTINSIEPLEDRMQLLDAKVLKETKQLQRISYTVDEELLELRRLSSIYASKHEEKNKTKGSELRWRRKLPGTIGCEKHYPKIAVRDGNYRFKLPGEYGEPFRSDLRKRMNAWYRKQAQPWFAHDVDGHYGDPNHEDHPERVFAHERLKKEKEIEDERIAKIKHDKKLTKRLIERISDDHLHEIMNDEEKLHHHVSHHRKEMWHEDNFGKTVWKWTWTHKMNPHSGHTRTELLSAMALDSLLTSEFTKKGLMPVAPN